MAIIAFVSPKGSPGVTTTALACTLSWHSRVVLAECDPAGGSLMAGYLGGALEGPRGIGELAVSELRDGRLEQDFWGQLVDLDAPKRQRLLLPGLANPAQAGSLTPLWGRFADFFTRLEYENPGFDVLADCGRLHVANPPWPVLRAASAVLVVTSARLPDLSNAAATLEAIGRDLRDNGVPPGTVRLVVVGGGHGKGEISRALGVPVAAHLPIDRQTAQVLSYGGTVRGRRPLMRAAAALEMPVRSMVDRRRARSTWNTMVAPMPSMPQPAQSAAPHAPATHQTQPTATHPAHPAFTAQAAAHQTPQAQPSAHHTPHAQSAAHQGPTASLPVRQPPAATHQEPAPAPQAATPAQQVATPAQQAATPAQQAATPAQQVATPAHQTAIPAYQTANPADQTADPAHGTGIPAQPGPSAAAPAAASAQATAPASSASPQVPGMRPAPDAPQEGATPAPASSLWQGPAVPQQAQRTPHTQRRPDQPVPPPTRNGSPNGSHPAPDGPITEELPRAV
ncbi:hypothetical protein JCM9534A_31690 [Catenuloplanes indicus JCM 9534]|uniref:Cellulose biosynthesis protein BcsQ n=1 Tax=Catenuloplanes indicus TaxID=137267 RepID=A0AAE4AXR9_9ACTN|nr:hypothetical protein [Catenuloplanes indicus]